MMEANDHDQVVVEKQALDYRIDTLRRYLCDGSAVDQLTRWQLAMLRMQLAAMEVYSRILNERLMNWSTVEK